MLSIVVPSTPSIPELPEPCRSSASGNWIWIGPEFVRYLERIVKTGFATCPAKSSRFVDSSRFRRPNARFLPDIVAQWELNTEFIHMLKIGKEQLVIKLSRWRETRCCRVTCTLKSTTTGTADEFIEVAICDTGTGIPVESADQVFDAFFSTKSDGIGIGLAISRTIIESTGVACG